MSWGFAFLGAGVGCYRWWQQLRLRPAPSTYAFAVGLGARVTVRPASVVWSYEEQELFRASHPYVTFKPAEVP